MIFLKQHALALRNQALPSQFALVLLTMAFAAMLSACGGSVHIPASTTSGPQLYMSPIVYGTTSGSAFAATSVPATYSVNDTALTFGQDTYSFSGAQSGARLNYAGEVTALSRGLLELELTYACGSAANAACTGVTTKPQAGSGWAVELADQGGGLLQLTGQPFVPLVPAVTCPSMKDVEAFLFVTLPTPLSTTGIGADAWDPQLETAYGSVDISVSGSTVTLAKIKQNTLDGRTLDNTSSSSSSSITGACSSTVYGNTVAIPPNPTVTSTYKITSPQAMMGIGPSGLLVEDNGGTSYLGAGTGAIGLPKASSALSTSSLVAAQYQGFFYSSGKSGYSTTWSSSVASFGFTSLPSTCAAVVPQTSTMIYGGDFTGNNPAASTVQSGGGFGNCDFAIDLGTQDTSTNGLYPAATVYVGSGFAANTFGKSYSFPSVAIAGQLSGKFAIFLIGADTVGSPNQAWGIYLLQSN